MSFRNWSIAFVVLVFAVAAAGLGGYLFHINTLGSFKEGYIPMAPSTAICFFISAAALAFLVKPRFRFFSRVFLMSLTLLSALFGLLEVAGHFLGMELNFEDVLIPVSGYLNGVPVGRMSPATGALFFLSGVVLSIYLNGKGRRAVKKSTEYISGALNTVLFTAAIIFCLAYLYGTPLLYQNQSTIPMAVTTALGFVFLSGAIFLAKPGSMPVRLVSEDTTRGYLLRYILPLVIISSIVGGVTTYFSAQAQTINPAFSSAAITILVVIIAGVLATVIARKLTQIIESQRQDLKRSRNALRKSEEQFRILFETMTEGVVYQNSKGEITEANPAAKRLLGESLPQMFGEDSNGKKWKVVDKDKNELSREQLPSIQALRNGKSVVEFVQGVYDSGLDEYIWLQVNSVPLFRTGSDIPYRVYSTFLETTHRTKASEELNKLKDRLQDEVAAKTKELDQRVAELEHFYEVTIERELRMEELRREINTLKGEESK